MSESLPLVRVLQKIGNINYFKLTRFLKFRFPQKVSSVINTVETQRVRNVSLSKNVAYVLNGWSLTIIAFVIPQNDIKGKCHEFSFAFSF